MKQWYTLIILFVLASVIAACSGNAAPPEAAQVELAAPSFETQSNNEQAVTVEVTPLDLAEGDNTLVFEVAFNTHFVELDFDPATLTVLRDAQGREYPAVAWEGDPAGGHHRSGTLQFELPNPPTGSVEVIIREVAGAPERVFQWDLVEK